jgi:hypothetical protein
VRIALLAVITALLVTAASAIGAVDARRPSLLVTDLAPLTVRGANFKPSERVKLLVNAGTPITRAVRTGTRGRFVARLGIRLDATSCSVVVQAIGAAGSRALVDLSRPGCDERP